jgi:hypothetical protein
VWDSQLINRNIRELGNYTTRLPEYVSAMAFPETRQKAKT